MPRPKSQSIDTDMQRLFIQRGRRRSLLMLRKFLIQEEKDGGHRIKRALYIGIERLWPKSVEDRNLIIPKARPSDTCLICE